MGALTVDAATMAVEPDLVTSNNMASSQTEVVQDLTFTRGFESCD